MNRCSKARTELFVSDLFSSILGDVQSFFCLCPKRRKGHLHLPFQPDQRTQLELLEHVLVVGMGRVGRLLRQLRVRPGDEGQDQVADGEQAVLRQGFGTA